MELMKEKVSLLINLELTTVRDDIRQVNPELHYMAHYLNLLLFSELP